MNFARAWLSRLISLGTVSPYKQPKDRLQAARENLAASLKPDPDYRRHCWSIRALTQALRAKGIVR